MDTPSETTPYEHIETAGAHPIKAWTRGVPFDDVARAQLAKIAMLPFIHSHVAVMPDVHAGVGVTVGAVIATRGAVIPAAVGVDIGCGMMAVQTTLTANDLPTSLGQVRTAIERAIPIGWSQSMFPRGGWATPPSSVLRIWQALSGDYTRITERHPEVASRDRGVVVNQLGTLGGGNHFIEVCLDEVDRVWFMLHSGSRGVGNRIGTHFIELARRDMQVHHRNAPDRDLAYLSEGTEHFDAYLDAVGWAQEYARVNRVLMMTRVGDALRRVKGIRPFQDEVVAVNCHHNYVTHETHFGEEVLVTRKGAVRAGLGDLGIIPGSMGARSYIVRGKGNPESFESCSHGAGRAMSRTAARERFSVADHKEATRGVECRKDADMIDETPGAYKSIDDVIAAERDLVDVVHTLRQVVCVKG